MKKLILASSSPRRKMLLEWAELSFEIQPSDADEFVDPSLSPVDVALSIANRKNEKVFKDVQANEKNFIILSADTIVVLNNEIIGKPQDRSEAIEILQQLSGQTHEVVTGVCLKDDQIEISFTETTQVSFYALTYDQIIHYIDVYKPYDKAGGYAIQEWIGVVGIKEIKGDFYNVMGLPVSRVVASLKSDYNFPLR
jgi:septum formation protein